MILDQILQAPDEFKVDKAKEAEADSETSEADYTKTANKTEPVVENKKTRENPHDYEAVSLMKRYRTFGRQTPEFLLSKIDLAEEE